jgi:hypothetical protein
VLLEFDRTREWVAQSERSNAPSASGIETLRERFDGFQDRITAHSVVISLMKADIIKVKSKMETVIAQLPPAQNALSLRVSSFDARLIPLNGWTSSIDSCAISISF